VKTTPHLLVSTLLLAALLATGALGCDDVYTNEGVTPEVEQAEFITFVGAGIGMACAEDDVCRDGLVCGGGKCLPSEEKQRDAKCLLTEECDPSPTPDSPNGLHCGWAGFCVPAGDGGEGDDCSTSSECERGMFCDMQGLSGYCAWPQPATSQGDLHDSCESTYDCMAGLRCSSTTDDGCVPGSLLLFPDLFSGVACFETAEEDLPFGVRMAVPGTETHTDYFAFPHPSDATLNTDGTVNLLREDGISFPVPGPGLIGFDPIGATAQALDDEVKGWSLLSGAWFRFSRAIDDTTLVADGADPTVRLVNLSTGDLHPIVVSSDPLRNKYACGNRVFLQPVLARPLDPSTPYAAILTTGILSKEDEGVIAHASQPLEAMTMLLGDAAPTGAVELRAHTSFAPLRARLGQGNTPSADQIAGATVFTTGAPTAIVGKIYDLVHETALTPSIVWKTQCEPGTPSRCATPSFDATPDTDTGVVPEDNRACPSSTSTSYTEYHTLVRIPVIQQGTRPYLEGEPGEAGDFSGVSGDLYFEDGELAAYGTEDICVSMSIPTGIEPTGGWPVLLYGHGTGGTHRQGIVLLGEELGRLPNGIEPKAQFVVVAWDQPMHHLRRFPVEAVKDLTVDTFELTDGYESEYAKEPGPLFYNFMNPRAARANYLQAAADTFSLVRLLREANFNFGPGVGPIKLDANRIAYHGHSQGGGNGPMVAPFEDGIGLMILSGTGGSTVDGILGKKEPYDSSIGCRIMLQEIDVTRTHPGMHILQHYFDAIDPALYGPLLDAPPATDTLPNGAGGMNFMEVIGVGDSFTPPISMAAYAGSARLDLLAPSTGVLPVWADDMVDDLITYASGNTSNNRTVGDDTITRVAIQHPPCLIDDDCAGGVPSTPSFDGHFVVYRNLDALAEMLSFIHSWSLTGTALVIPAGSNAN